MPIFKCCFRKKRSLSKRFEMLSIFLVALPIIFFLLPSSSKLSNLSLTSLPRKMRDGKKRRVEHIFCKSEGRKRETAPQLLCKKGRRQDLLFF